MTDGLPPDVNQDSRCRLPLPRRRDLPVAAREIYDRHADPEGGTLAGLRGPGGIKLHSPGYAVPAFDVLQYLRHGTGIQPAVRELAILVTAREHDSAYEWSKHEPEALHQGVPQETIDTIKHRRPVDGLSETEAMVITFGRQLFQTRRVQPEVFAEALDAFGRQKLVDLVCLMGTYAGTASLLAAFDAHIPDDETFILPVP
jgi:4-carboxymuconolactone decarboxylase